MLMLCVHCRQPISYGYSENFDTYRLDPKVTEFHAHLVQSGSIVIDTESVPFMFKPNYM